MQLDKTTSLSLKEAIDSYKAVVNDAAFYDGVIAGWNEALSEHGSLTGFNQRKPSAKEFLEAKKELNKILDNICS